MRANPLICVFLACSLCLQLVCHADPQSAENQVSDESPRLNQPRSRLVQGDRSSLDRFWHSLATKHTPVLEPITNDTEDVLVTFGWRGNAQTKGVSVVCREMTRLLETDLWFTTVRMPKIPVFYSFFPRLAGGTEQPCADPLNPYRFFVPPEVAAAVPADLQAAQSQWRNRSMLLFGENPAVFADFVAKDLMSWVRKKWRSSTDPRHTIVCGYSRGGLAAAYVAWKHPEVFGNVLAQSGAFWRGNEGGIDDPEWLTKQFQDSPRQRLRFYIEVGSEETGKTPAGPIFIEANRRLYQTLKTKGYDVDYVEVSRGRHDPINWRFQLGEGIRFLAARTP